VSLLDGRPDKKRYRSFHVKSTSEGDDYGAMYEVLARRFRRGRVAAASAEGSQAPAPAEEGERAEGSPKPLPRPPEPALVEVREATARASGSAKAAASASANANASDGAPTTPSKKRETDWELPDLLVVDGGRGQLNVALSAARDLGLHDLPIVGLAKERESPTSGEKLVDRVYLPGQKNGIPLRTSSSALFFLARARDEAHRFANHARKKLGKARRLRSEIEDIRGLGSDAKKALLRELGSMAAVRRATDQQILAVPGISRRHLTALRKVIPGPEPVVAPSAKTPPAAPVAASESVPVSVPVPAPADTVPPPNAAPQNEQDGPEDH
jgi:excinuclease ABC subunit C